MKIQKNIARKILEYVSGNITQNQPLDIVFVDMSKELELDVCEIECHLKYILSKKYVAGEICSSRRHVLSIFDYESEEWVGDPVYIRVDGTITEITDAGRDFLLPWYRRSKTRLLWKFLIGVGGLLAAITTEFVVRLVFSE
jgi:hypothetical protein